jgi:Glycosyl hydrolases family 25
VTAAIKAIYYSAEIGDAMTTSRMSAKQGIQELMKLVASEDDVREIIFILHQARDFVSLFEQHTGPYPVLYGGAWLNEQLNGKADDLLARCPLWISQHAAKPALPPGWNKYALWQYTDGENGPEPHEVAGIGPCDRNQYNGTIIQLRKRWPFS